MTMLATQSLDLNRAMEDGSKTVNLIAFTPATSFEKGHRSGRVGERALLWWLVADLFLESKAQQNALERILRVDVSEERWRYECSLFQKEEIVPDPGVVAQFSRALKGSSVLRRLREFVADMTYVTQFKGSRWQRRAEIVSDLRALLAKVSVACLEPDLIILDEFQRFKHLLDRPQDGAEAEVSQLANDLFTAERAKVLLLSATPYRMFTFREERDLTGDDHYADFISTVDFLGGHQSGDRIKKIERALKDFRSQAIAGGNPLEPKAQVEHELRQVMCRTERPLAGTADMLTTKADHPEPPTSDDLLGYVAMRRVADEIEGQLSIEYWKSAPYFLNFMDGYQLSRRFKRFDFAWGQRQKLLKGAQLIDRSVLKAGGDIEPGNARLRQLVAETLDKGLWRLLWLPPSLTYYEPAGAYADVDPADTTKRLIFSSWAAAPTAISALLSWSALRRMRGDGKVDAPGGARLAYRIADGRPAGMTALALFVPTPGLAGVTDPLEFAREDPGATLTSEMALSRAASRVSPLLAAPREASSSLSPDTWYWASPFAIDGEQRFANLAAIIADEETFSEDGGLQVHLNTADDAAGDGIELGSQPRDLDRWVALIGMTGPGNVAWRALRRVTSGALGVSDEAILRAAAIIGAGFRTLFNRPEVMALLDQEESKSAYWQSVLEYCLAGNLQAVMDEYLHHLVGNSDPETDEDLLDLARSVRSALALRTSPVSGFDPLAPEAAMRFPLRFAVRYGSAKGQAKSDEVSQARLGDVQRAFNSPFWPMVLASTSVGQEGIDFHWWCHSIVHWNLPANPVDFEQREGRVLRFKGHAIRKNVGIINRIDALSSELADPWVAAFMAAERRRPEGMNDLWPWWAYDGDVKVERWIPCFPLSRDTSREERLRRQRAIYRLAFGQPRQQDLLSLLEDQLDGVHSERSFDLRIDLRPPKM